MMNADTGMEYFLSSLIPRSMSLVVSPFLTSLSILSLPDSMPTLA